jgi:hypothetical protein
MSVTNITDLAEVVGEVVRSASSFDFYCTESNAQGVYNGTPPEDESTCYKGKDPVPVWNNGTLCVCTPVPGGVL